MRAKIIKVGNKVNNKVTRNKKVNRLPIIIEKNQTKKDVTQQSLMNNLHASEKFYAPFILRLENVNKHNKNGGFEILAKPLNFDILFGSGFYGYIVKVGDSHMEEDTTEMKSLEYYKDKPEVSTIYKFAHDQNIENHATQIVDYATAWKDGNAARHKSADSITKVIGEGSRWQAVASLADRGTLRDSSIFYIHDDDPDAKPAQITLDGLWATWKSPFNNKFNIPDNELKVKLQQGTGSIKDRKIPDAKCKTIKELQADNANYKLQ